jgi:imidazoleglycerol phosphate synthase cyclase subunit
VDVYPRLIPALLLQDGRLVKTRQFDDPVYVGDPVNVLSIFNDFEVDEIALLDISAARSRDTSSVELLHRLSTECFVPLAYGGGIDDAETAREIIACGFEKVVVNSLLVDRPDEVGRIVAALGSQAVVGSVDVRHDGDGYQVFTRGGTVATGLGVEQWADIARRVGVGEVLVTSIDREGTRKGIDLDLVKLVTSLLPVPVVAHGGAGDRDDLVSPVRDAGASAVAAGSQFVFQRGRESVLINYPSRTEIGRLFRDVTKLHGGEQHARVAGPVHLEAESTVIDEDRTCRRCLITTDVPNAGFDANGICYYCRLHDTMEAQYPTGAEGRRRLEALATRLREAGRGKPYDCILGVSGGCDSSYLVHLMVELGVRPLAVHFDNTWNSPTATANIYAVLGALDIDLETYVVDNTEYDDIYRAFMLAGVRDVEAPTDIGFMGVLYRAAEKHGIRHIIEGHSFRTEGVSPLGWLYMDGGYIKGVHDRYGSVPMRTYPNMEFAQFVKWAALSRIERTRPLYFLDYHKEDVKHFLRETYGWEWYGGHHLENRFTAFYHTYLLPTRFGIDFRQIEVSALIRSGQITRAEGAARLFETRLPDPELLAMVKKRLHFSDEEFEQVMTAPQRTYRDFPTYKTRFERLRPFFWLMYKTGRVPKSFYVKFCTR